MQNCEDDTFKGREELQRILKKLEFWTITRHMNFSKSQYQILHLGRSNPGSIYRLRSNKLQSIPAERTLGVQVESKLNMSQ